MALTSETVRQMLSSNMLVFTGSSRPSIVAGLALGFHSWLVDPVYFSLSGSVTGAAGSGTIVPNSTKIFVPPKVEAMIDGLNSATVEGVVQVQLAQALTFGFSQSFNFAQYTGVSLSVATGQDFSFPQTIDTMALVTSLYDGLKFFTEDGHTLYWLAQGVARGLRDMILAATCTGTVVGTPVPPTTVVSGPTFSHVL